MKYPQAKNIVENPFILWLLGLLVSIPFVFLLGQQQPDKFILLSDYFLYEFRAGCIDYKELFATVCSVRIPMALFCILGARKKYGLRFRILMFGYLGFTMGYLLLTLAILYGVQGVYLCMLLWCPHMFLYLFAMYLYVTYYSLVGRTKFTALCLFFLGLIGEIFIHPSLLKFFLFFLEK